MGTICFPEMLNKFEKTLAVTEIFHFWGGGGGGIILIPVLYGTVSIF